MNKKITGLCRFFIIFGLAFIILYPVIYMFSCSFRDSIDMNDISVMWIPKHFTLDVIAETKIVPSKAEGRRLIQQGGLSINGEKVTEVARIFTEEDIQDGAALIKRGKKNYTKIEVQ